MLLRQDDRGVLAIGQASHAWLSGQLARGWGNEAFGPVEPWEEVCLAAEQHDVGMAAWDLEPTYDPASGLPVPFMDMALSEHLRLWMEGPRRVISQSAYAALLISLHGWRLYERRDLDRRPPEEAEQIRRFLAYQRDLQRELMTRLDGHPGIDPAVLERNSLLVWTWDYISLALCLNWAPATAEGAPTARGRVDIQILARPDGSYSLEPWPLQAERVTVRCEGRRLPRPLASEAEMRSGLAQAPVEILELVLARSA